LEKSRRKQVEKEKQQKEARMLADAKENARRYCDDCKTELSPDALFCPQCRSSRISNRGQIRVRELAEERSKRRKQREEEPRIQAAKAHEEQVRKEREQASLRQEAARKRCREIAAWKYCARCGCERETTHQFCIKCSGVLELIPPTLAFERAKKEFPAYIRTKEDFNRFVK
jgi:hypothetical protein